MSLFFEGTKDFLVTTPALIVTFTAETSINAGDALVLSTTTQKVGNLGARSSTNFIGVAYESVASGSQVGVIVWGFCKNLTASATLTPGGLLGVTGSKFEPVVLLSGSTFGQVVGKAYSNSGSAATFQGFISGFGA